MAKYQRVLGGLVTREGTGASKLTDNGVREIPRSERPFVDSGDEHLHRVETVHRLAHKPKLR